MNHAIRNAGRRRLAVSILVAAATVLSVVGSFAPAGAQARAIPEAPDQLSPEEDNVADLSKSSCQDVRSPAGSLVIRRLLDGPRQANGTLAFVSGVCIYLPPGYEDNTKRYPVLYLLHGAFGWQEDWFRQGHAQEVLDEAYAEDPNNAMIVVTPDGTYDARWSDSPSGYPMNETYVFDHVIPYVDTYFRTIPDRRGRAMSGLSNGGAGTLRLSALHPDHFSVVTAMSAALPVNMAANRSDIREVANDPTEIAENLELVDLALIYGRDPCGADDPSACQTYGFAWAFENVCCSNELYAAKLRMVQERPFTFEAVVGGHDWHYWTAWLRSPHGPFIRERLIDPIPHDPADTWPYEDLQLSPLEAPESFDYRGIKSSFDMYDYTFENDPGRAREFLTLTDVSADGLTARGSGTLNVVTAARYVPGATYEIAGAGTDGPVIADGEGRLSFPVDLGTAHTADEGTPQQRAAEAQAGGSYWVTRQITITPQT